jgi:hypothetical protein
MRQQQWNLIMNSIAKAPILAILLMALAVSNQVYALTIDTQWIDDTHLASSVLSIDPNSAQQVGCVDTSCHVGVGFLLKSEPKAGVTVDEPIEVHGSTVGELERNVVKQVGLPFNTTESFHVRDGHENPTDYCATLVYIIGSEQNGNYRQLDDSSLCADLPPKNVTCKITPDTINIGHGALSSGEVDGHKASETVQISCTEEAAVTFNFAETSIPLIAGEGSKRGLQASNITSSLQINGIDIKSAEYKFNGLIDSVGLPLSISSILHSSGISEPGSYSGSEVFIYSPE